jgi:hypothetical protein
VDPPSDPCMVLLRRQTSRTACHGALPMMHGHANDFCRFTEPISLPMIARRLDV